MPADIRPARASDVHDLCALEEEVFAGDRISRRSFRSLLASGSAAVLVRRSGADIEGYAVVLFRRGSRSGRLYSIAADPRFAGVGRSLLEAAEQEALRRGADEIRLEVREDNERAISLYRRNGYVRRDLVAGYYEDGAAALRMAKPLVDSPGTAAA